MPSKKNRDKHKNKTKKILTKSIKVSCQPSNEGNRIIRGSCFTKGTLELLKSEYNINNPNNRIMSDKPRTIWKLLKNRLRTCTKEDCLLSIIADKTQRDKLEKHLFVPRPLYPSKWRQDENAWLSNFDIDHVLKEYEVSYPAFKFIRTVTIDFADVCIIKDLCNFDLTEMNETGKSKMGVVFNLAKYLEKGTHWVSLYVDLDDKIIFYFDSNGNEPPKEIIELINTIRTDYSRLHYPEKLTYHDTSHIQHQYGNTECGMYALFFIITMLTNKVNNIPISELEDKLNIFKGKRLPDEYVSKFRKTYFKMV